MVLEPKITIQVPNTPIMRRVLRDLVDHLYEIAPQAPSYDATSAYEVLAAAVQLSLEPEQLEKDPHG